MADETLFRPRLQEAISFAARAHQGQFRKDGVTPYSAHIMRVAATVSLEFGCADEDVILAALLHDILEDTDHDFDDLAERFGVQVATMVASLTKANTLPREQRDQCYYEHLATCDWKTRIVKVADSLDNLREGITGGKRAGATKKARHALELSQGDQPELVRAREILARTLTAEASFPLA